MNKQALAQYINSNPQPNGLLQVMAHANLKTASIGAILEKVAITDTLRAMLVGGLGGGGFGATTGALDHVLTGGKLDKSLLKRIARSGLGWGAAGAATAGVGVNLMPSLSGTLEKIHELQAAQSQRNQEQGIAQTKEVHDIMRKNYDWNNKSKN